jgi:hypothetical protein
VWHRKARLTPGEAVVAEAEALLDGRMLELYRCRGMLAPPWALINALAHAPVTRLRLLASEAPTHDPASLDAVVGRLAAGILALGVQPDDVIAVQRDLLVQVELILLALGRSAPVTVAELELMLGTLFSCRRERREHQDPQGT